MTSFDDRLPRAALVTGGAVRIGRAIAEDLADAGFAVAIHYRGSGEAAETVAEAIRRRGGQAVTLGADLALEADTQALLPAAAKALGQPIGVLINNASLFEYDSAETATRDSWDLHMEANLRAPFVLTQALATQLPAEALGNVVNLIDQRVWSLTPHFTTYTLSKAGLWTLTQTLALALAPRIRVNGIGPGPALPSPRQDQAQFDAQCAAMPLGHGTHPQEIASAVRFILATSGMTGQMIALDGGQHLGWAYPGHDAPLDE